MRSAFLGSRCPACRQLVAGACAPCWARVAPAPGSAVVPAAIAFTGTGRQLIIGMKYANARTLARPLARRMADRVDGDIDVVTWAPTSPRRVRGRGYDQAELLARAVGRELDVPVRSMLRRLRGEAPQTGRSRDERVRDAPEFKARAVWQPIRVLVVDDVVTTGATLLAAERALRRAGCSEVSCVAAAATP